MASRTRQLTAHGETFFFFYRTVMAHCTELCGQDRDLEFIIATSVVWRIKTNKAIDIGRTPQGLGAKERTSTSTIVRIFVYNNQIIRNLQIIERIVFVCRDVPPPFPSLPTSYGLARFDPRVHGRGKMLGMKILTFKQILILRKPWVVVLTPRTLYHRYGENRISTLPTTVRAIAIFRPLGDDPRTRVRECGRVVHWL
jgi:hypothetical protein